MKRVPWAFAGPVAGILFVLLSLAGLVIHGYPSGSGTQIKHWIDTTNSTRFAVGIWIEAVGYLFLLVFAGWLREHLRRPGVSSWPGDVAFGAAIVCSGTALLANGIWMGVVDSGRAGADPSVLMALTTVAVDVYAWTLPFYGLFLIAAGAMAVLARSLPPWLAWSAVVIGIFATIPPTSLPAGGALLLWILAVCGRAGMSLRTS